MNYLRITMKKVETLLLCTSLDEFPQFWSVIKGKMSSVDSRPSLPDEVGLYKITQWQRLNVELEMTGG
ncbi:MAG: sugar transferase [cyanobacterium endosymbiont of Rhopalodia sterrenbergii]